VSNCSGYVHNSDCEPAKLSSFFFCRSLVLRLYMGCYLSSTSPRCALSAQLCVTGHQRCRLEAPKERSTSDSKGWPR
jgi:hypothetical protein